jgi:hypothetical protein
MDEYGRDLESSIEGVLEHLEIINIALFRMAENLAKEANAALNSRIKRAAHSPRIGLAARRRNGFWGPRLVWVRIGGPREGRVASGRGQRGEWTQVARVTREFAMPDGLSVHLNAFDGIEEPVRGMVRDFEIRAREIRETAKVFRDTYLGSMRVRRKLETRRSAPGRSGSGLVREA